MVRNALFAFAIRWCACVFGLWAALVLLHLQLTPPQAWNAWPLTVAFRIGEMATSPFEVLAWFASPAVDGQYTFAHYGFRFAFGSLLYGTLAAIGWQIAWWHRRPALTGATADAGRRRFLARAAGAVAVAATAGPAVWVTGVAPNQLRVRRYRVPIRGLPAPLDGVRLVHLSDTHYGPYVTFAHLRRAVRLANEQDADLAVLTGDYIHRTPAAIEQGIGLFADLRTRHGTVAVLGNHDHWEDAEGCRRRFAEIDVPLVDNAHLFLSTAGLSRVPIPGASLAVMGVADLAEAMPDPRLASEGIASGCPRLLLSHHPDVAEHFAADHPDLRVDLQLSGHTHGGQVRLPGQAPHIVPSEFGLKYAGGLVDGPQWPVVVSRGLGMVIAPVRLGVPPEIGVITLERA